MGMYTAIHFNSELNVDKDSMVADILNYMLGDIEELPEMLPDHPLFKTDRWQIMLRCDSYYFDEDTHSTMRWDDISNAYYLCVRSNLKDYDDEIEKFVNWIMPYCANKEDGDFLGFSRYEENEQPDLIFYDAVDPETESTDIRKGALA